MTHRTKPPFGVEPRWRWLDGRAIALHEAIGRYLSVAVADVALSPEERAHRYGCVAEWAAELAALAADRRGSMRP